MKTNFHISSTFISISRGKQKISFDEITHLEGMGNYTIIHTRDFRKTVTAFTLKRFTEVIQKGCFIRTHKSFIINPLYVTSYFPTDSKIEILGNKIILISKRNRLVLAQLFGKI